MSDIIVTSTNARKIVEQIPADKKIIFAPDQHLGRYLSKTLNREMILWQGSCIVHEQFSEKELVKLKTNHPKALVIAHPECTEALLMHAHHIGSTSSLINFVAQNQGCEFIVLTEPNIIHQMRQKNPSAVFYDCPFVDKAGCTLCNTCPYMQLNNLEKIHAVISGKIGVGGEIFLDEAVRVRAERSLRKMLEMS